MGHSTWLDLEKERKTNMEEAGRQRQRHQHINQVLQVLLLTQKAAAQHCNMPSRHSSLRDFFI